MGPDRPGAEELLGIARDSLLAQLLPQLQGEGRYLALMIANALAMARRELEGAGADYAEAMRQAATELAGGVAETQAQFERRLVVELREGRLSHRSTALRRYLLALTLRRLAVSNPRYAAAHGQG